MSKKRKKKPDEYVMGIHRPCLRDEPTDAKMCYITHEDCEAKYMEQFFEVARELGRKAAARMSISPPPQPVTVSATCTICKRENVIEVMGNRFDGLLKEGWGSSLSGVVVCPDCLKGFTPTDQPGEAT